MKRFSQIVLCLVVGILSYAQTTGLSALNEKFENQIANQWYAEALNTGKQLIDECSSTFGALSTETAYINCRLANIYSAMRDFRKANTYITKAIDIMESIGETNTENYAIYIDNRSKYLSELGEHKKAFDESKKAVPLWRQLVGEKSLDYAKALGNYAQNALNLGLVTEAMNVCKQSLDITKETSGDKSFDYAVQLDNLASLYAHTGNYPEAIRLNLEAYDIWKNAIHDNGWDIAICAANMGQHYYLNNDLENAIRYLDEAIGRFQKLGGDNERSYWDMKLMKQDCLERLNVQN